MSRLEALIVKKANLEERLKRRNENRARIAARSTAQEMRKWDRDTRKIRRNLLRVNRQLRRYD